MTIVINTYNVVVVDFMSLWARTPGNMIFPAEWRPFWFSYSVALETRQAGRPCPCCTVHFFPRRMGPAGTPPRSPLHQLPCGCPLFVGSSEHFKISSMSLMTDGVSMFIGSTDGSLSGVPNSFRRTPWPASWVWMWNLVVPSASLLMVPVMFWGMKIKSGFSWIAIAKYN